MKKYYLFTLSLSLLSALLAGAVTPISAETPAAIAIIDTGTNSAIYADSYATEVCILSSYKCANGKSFMEGAGAANLPVSTNKDLSHGIEMISITLRVNPAAKIIPIRIVGVTPNGNPSLYSLDDVKAALDWVIANRIKYNIAVVSLSQGKVFPNCKVPSGVSAQIALLKSVQVPLIAAVGNDGNHTSVFSPACLNDSIAIGATDNPDPEIKGLPYDPKAAPYIARYSNGAQGQTDFFTNARWYAKQLDGSMRFIVGTSNATAAISGYWLLNRKATFDETYAAILANTTAAKNEFQSGRYVNIESIPLGNSKT